MKQRKNISKIALLAGLLTINSSANSFYQCVPKKAWVEEIVKSLHKCPAGQYSKDLMCINCPPGTYSNTGSKSCSSCPEGTYASGYGNTSCSYCSSGTYASGTGNSSCSSCSYSNCETSGYGATSCYSRCGGSTPYCNGSGSCVECTSDSHCSGSTPYCSKNHGCVECTSSFHCDPEYKCSIGRCKFDEPKDIPRHGKPDWLP